MKRIAFQWFLTFLPLLGGCLGIVPTDHHAAESGPRGCSRGNAEAMIEDGKTTRPQLAEKLGTGIELARGRLWVYTFQDYHDHRFFWWLILVSPAGGGAVGKTASLESSTNYHLLLEFDDTDTVTRHRLRREGRINRLAGNWDEVFQ